jgi:Ser/Thr protein kinase RdoA (MazF antagonist)
MKDKVACLITTDHTKRGVFMGFIDPDDAFKESIVAYDIMMCVYWSSEMHGVLGLASDGPNENCRISPAAKKAIIHGVTAVIEITEKALKNWQKQPWGKI